MNTSTTGNGSFQKCIRRLTHTLAGMGFLFCAVAGQAQLPPGATNSTAYTPLDSWYFQDTNGWTTAAGYAPVSFTNLTASPLGDGLAVVVDNSNSPAWLQYRTIETNGAISLTVSTGSVVFWFAPDWASTNQGGNGPGTWGRLLETGAYTTNASTGWWSIYVDPPAANLYFSTQTNDNSGATYTLSAPIAWTTNRWHCLALTYSGTNISLYLDGQLATNDPAGLTRYPGPDALTNGFWIGSDSTGMAQAHGMFDDLQTYNVVLDPGTIAGFYSYHGAAYYLNPLNPGNSLASAPSSPSFSPSYQAISGSGWLQWDGSTGSCVSGTNAYQVWLTNITASASANGTMNVTFSIEGGAAGAPYDVFATSALQSPITNAVWAWMGQGYQCNTYTVTNLPNAEALLILGTPLDSNSDGVSDAYSLLVAHMDPYHVQFDSYGVPYAWYVQNGLNPNGAATLDLDQDGLLNYQEYQYGTRPQVSEGFSVWVSTPNGISAIP